MRDRLAQRPVLFERNCLVGDGVPVQETLRGANDLRSVRRRFADERFDPAVSFEQQCRLAEELMTEKIIPHLVQPLTEVIAQRRST